MRELPNLWQSVWTGAKRRYVQGFAAAFAFLGILWTVTEIAEFVSSAAKTFLEGHLSSYLVVAIGGFVGTFALRTYEPRKVTFDVPTTDTKITLKFSDLFTEPTDVVVAATEFMDSEIGQRVAPGSIHGQLIQKWFNSEADFRSAVDPQLVKHSGKKTSRSPGPNIAYPLGTTIRVDAGPKRVYLFAFAHAHVSTAKAHVDLSEAIAALRKLLLYVHDHSNGRAVAMPLIGNGQSGLNLPPQHLLRLLVLLIVAVAREKGLPKDIRVCLHDDCFEALDLREIARDWRHD